MKNKKLKRIALYGGSFNPPGRHHIEIIKILAKEFDEVFVVPCGERPDKRSTKNINPRHRANMLRLAMIEEGLRRPKLDLFDVEKEVFTRNHELEERYARRGEVWHVVGTDIIEGGSRKQSRVHKDWERGEELWKELNFAVLDRPGYKTYKKDLPKKAVIIPLDLEEASSTDIRNLIGQKEPVDHLLHNNVIKYIQKNKLYS